MRPAWMYGTIGIVLAYFAACAPVHFEQAPEPSCGGNGVSCVQKCSDSGCVRSYSVEQVISRPLVDILLIDDNSGSMSPHQSKFATAFSGFVSQLDNSMLDYRIAITTTDISNKYSTSGTNAGNGPDDNNGQGAYQDGGLITFPSGAAYLSNADTNRDALFINTVKRPETVRCEQSGYSQCPSDDERGVFAANLVLENSASKFFRPTSHLAIIVLSNEDERGLSDPRAATQSGDLDLIRLYPLENFDLPETFLTKFRNQYPSKTLAVHSIIIKPGDYSCLNSETRPAQFLRGKEGYSYAKLSNSTGGVVASICDSNYTSSLSAIAENIEKQALSLPFQCRPMGDRYALTFAPQPAVVPASQVDWGKMQLNINGVVPPGTKVMLTYDCSTAQ